MSSTLFENDNYAVGIPLSKFTEAVTRTVSYAPGLSGVWVIAELSDVRMSQGHCYMELIEKNEAGQTIAKMRANIWRSAYFGLRQKFFNATQREISTGIKALVKGSATHHSLYGLSFNITDIDPSYTMGDLERLRREILLKLHKEGVADLNKKKEIPLAPQKIAVISAQGAAGYGDFINHLCGNSEGFVFYPCLFPCVMQGDRVSESIRGNLMLIESMADFWDCVAIVRGGGATTDLNGFDDYELARAVATCGLPVVVGIGHERDRNVLDEVAHTSLKTPTAVAGFFIDKVREAYERTVSLTDQIRIISTDLIRGEEKKISALQGFIPQLALRKTEETKTRLQSISSKIPLMARGRLEKEILKIRNIGTFIPNISDNRISKETIKLDNILKFLGNIAGNKIQGANQKIMSVETLLKVLDPKNTLSRGYSITRINGKAVKSISEISTDDILITELWDGELHSKRVE